MDQKSPTKKRRRINTPPFIPNNLIAEILSFLPVKVITQLRCVSKLWNSLISDPFFIKKHLKKSSQNPNIVFTIDYPLNTFLSLPVSRLLDYPPSSIAVSGEVCSFFKENSCWIIGSCNGLLCLRQSSYSRYCFYIWNPATKTISDKLGFFRDYEHSNFFFSFGCDCLTGTYKIIAFHAKKSENFTRSKRHEVKIFSLGDNCWRDIQSFPFVLLENIRDGAHLSGTINWLAVRDEFESIFHIVVKFAITDVKQFLIVSLDLSTETYKQILLPSGFDKVPHYIPTLQIMRDCLCFSHDVNGTEFVIWQMKEFGVQESWIQLLRIDYVNFQMPNFPGHDDELNYLSGYMDDFIPLLPWYLSKNGDTMILLTFMNEHKFIIYNLRDERLVKTKISNSVYWHTATDYVESLASTCWKSVNIEEEEEDQRTDYIDWLKEVEEDQPRDDDLTWKKKRKKKRKRKRKRKNF